MQVFKVDKTIAVSFDPDTYVPLDSFVSKITIVPLETNANCLIGQPLALRVKLHQDLIYVSFLKQLFVFDLNGKFIREIGRRGGGPGEFTEVRDFIFSNDKTIELLNFKKIEQYTLEGKHIGTKRFDFYGDVFNANPMNFCHSFSKGYYFWGGVVKDDNLREKSSLMYQVNSDMEITNAYLSQQYGDGGEQDRFKYYQDKILVTPGAFDYNIYQIDPDDSIRIRYSFDFGTYGFDANRDVDRQNIMYDSYIWNIIDFHETDHHLHFCFAYQNKFHTLLCSKITGQIFLQSPQQYVKRKEFYLLPTVAVYNNQLIAMADISTIKDYLEIMSEEDIKKWGLERLRGLDYEDNPVLIFYTMKK
jgi:hypothetical protein